MFGLGKRKCARVGHKPRIEWRKGFLQSSSFTAVCDMAKQERQVCRRCGEPLSDWVTLSRRPVQSWSRSTAIADEFEETGQYWNEFGHRPSPSLAVEVGR